MGRPAGAARGFAAAGGGGGGRGTFIYTHTCLVVSVFSCFFPFFSLARSLACLPDLFMWFTLLICLCSRLLVPPHRPLA